MKTNPRTCLTVPVLLLGLFCPPLAGQIIYVDEDAPGSNNGSSWRDAYEDLQDALAAAQPGDEIRVAAGIYRPSARTNPDDPRTATFQLVNGASLRGGYAGFGEPDPNARDVRAHETILSGDLSDNDGPGFMNNDENCYHVVTGSGTDATTVLDGLTITAGNADRGGPPHCFGGGMYSESASPTVTNCTFNSNYSLNGGGMYNIYSISTITNCIFCGNSAGCGGAMLNDESGLMLVNCIFSGNTGGSTGGGIYDSHSNTTLVNCTFTQNSSNTWGGAIHGAFSEPTLTNCILWANTAESGSQISMKYGSVVSVSYCDVQGGQSAIYLYQSSVNWGDGNIDADPLFVNAEGADNIPGTDDDNLRLLAGSACLDAGDNAAVPPSVLTDLDGNPRFTDDPATPDTGSGTPPIVDMGAYEGPNNGLLLSTESVTIPEGGTAAFTVALRCEPNGMVEAAVTHESGDPDITVQSGALLIFDPCDYSVPQSVTLAAAEDADHIDGQALIVVAASGFYAVGVTATEEDNEPDKNILFVDAGAAGANNGSSWTDAFADLQEALSAAAVFPQFGQIRVAQGIYRPGGDRYTSFYLVNGVALYGGFPPGGGQWQDRDPAIYETPLSGDLNGDDGAGFADYDENTYHVVNSSGTDETTVLDGFTITGGNANGAYPYNAGGGIYNEGGEPSGSTPIISNCWITGNCAYYGGGMLNYYVGIVIVGAGGPGPALTNCNFSGNLAGEDGGAICNHSSNPELTNCVVNENFAAVDGGGICNYGSCPPLANCILSRNSADRNGGAVLNIDCWDPTFTNCTFNRNSAGAYGGGIYNWLTDPVVTNCILWANSDSDGTDESAQMYGASALPQLINYNCVEGWTGILGGTGNIGDDPCFVDAANEDFHLTAGSPCIDTGTNEPPGGLPATDIEDTPRPLDGDGDGNSVADMGAYEFRAPAPVIVVTPDEIEFSAACGGGNPHDRILSICNGGGGTLAWEITEDCPWLEVDPLTGQSIGEFNDVVLSADIAGLPWGKYSCFLTISAPDADNSPQMVWVDLFVNTTLRVPTQDYPTIQAAVDAAIDGDVVIVADGTYTGQGNRDIDFEGKAITVRSEKGPAGCIIDCQGTITEPHRAFHFHSGEDALSVVEGFTISGGNTSFGGGMRNDASSPTVRNCVFVANTAWYGGGMENDGASPTIINCIFSGNSADYGGGIDNYGGANANVTNCTFNGNTASVSGGAIFNDESALTITNCILWNNTPEQIYVETGTAVVSYSNVEGGWTGQGNIHADPCFADSVNGDYHLQSQSGRWSPDSECWVMDGDTSQCIDAGEPACDWTEELWPHGKCINMGAYGGTPQASMSLSGVGNVADLTGDSLVNFRDFAHFAYCWQIEDILLAEDLDRNGIVNFSDAQIFADNWLWQQ